MKFQYISDIHLEQGTVLNIVPYADNLILAGDIGDPGKKEYSIFLENMAAKFLDVFLISGNHEYYSNNRSMNDTEKMIKAIVAKYPNIHYLQNEVFEIPGKNISILGSTMWTRIDEHEANNIKCFISDYRCIPGFTIEQCNQIHRDSLLFLEETINKNEEMKWIIIMHHMPHTRLIDEKYRGMPLNSAFASDIPCLDQDHVIAVVYGHTHTPNIQGKYYCNPIGYPMENKHHNLQAVFEV